MNKWNDLMNEEPPSGHADRVMQAAKPELEKLAVGNRRAAWTKLFGSWEGLSAGGAIAAAVGGLWFLAQRQSNTETGELEIVAFQESLGSESTEDLELLTVEDGDLDLLEDLELLEEMEDV